MFIALEAWMLTVVPAMHAIGQMSALVDLLRQIPSLACVVIRARLTFHLYSPLLLS